MLNAVHLTVDRSISSQIGSSVRIAREIARDQGRLAGFYRGLSPNIAGNSISWALYFLWYDNVKDVLHVYHGPKAQLSYYDFFIASGTAGSI